MPSKVVLSLSGGVDSSTLLGYYEDIGAKAIPIFFDYGSKHGHWEKQACFRICSYYNLEPRIIDLVNVFRNCSSNLLKGGNEIPEGHHNDPAMRATIVPARNTIFISIMLGIAETEGAEVIAVGVHKGDQLIYPDCRLEYIQAISKAVGIASERSVRVEAPFIEDEKRDILIRGLSYKPRVPYGLTRTCYKDQPIACGKCGSCSERIEAFQRIGVKDPIEYEAKK